LIRLIYGRFLTQKVRLKGILYSWRKDFLSPYNEGKRKGKEQKRGMSEGLKGEREKGCYVSTSA
jgi:hypothetical protein